MMSEPTGYTETIGRLNDPDNWDVAGMLADIAKNLRDESDNGRAIAAIDFLMECMHEMAHMCRVMPGELLAIAIEARAELSNYTSDHFGGRNHSAISVIADLDAIIAKAGNGGRA